MSQFFIDNISSGPIPPQVPTSFTTDVGTAVPALNVIDVRGIDNTTAFVTTNNNNVNGIVVIGGAVQTNASNRIQVQLTNRIHGTATTTDGVTPVTIYTFDLGATPGTYMFFTRIVAYNLTDSISASYASFRGIRTTGAAGTLISANTQFISEETTMTNVTVANSIVGNNALLTAIGLAGKTIHWFAVTEYQFIS